MLKVSRLLKAKLDGFIRRELSNFLHSIPETRSVPINKIQNILAQGGFTLLQEDGTPWAGIISCPTEQNVRMVAPIGKFEGASPDANTAFPEVGTNLVLSLYRRQSGNMEVVGYLTDYKI